jgi:Na+-driven multidrug efflux pump
MSLIHPLAAATASRIHTLLQQHRIVDIRYAVCLSLFQTTLLAFLCGGILYSVNQHLGSVFTGNPDIVRRMSQLTWHAALFLLGLAVQTQTQSVMRILGYQLDVIG